jgi:hypothetical protein
MVQADLQTCLSVMNICLNLRKENIVVFITNTNTVTFDVDHT